MNFRLRLSELPLRGMNFGHRPNELRKAHCGVLIFEKNQNIFQSIAEGDTAIRPWAKFIRACANFTQFAVQIEFHFLGRNSLLSRLVSGRDIGSIGGKDSRPARIISTSFGWGCFSRSISIGSAIGRKAATS